MNKLTIRLAILTSIFLLGMFLGAALVWKQASYQIEFVNCEDQTVDEIYSIIESINN